jgi:uncharacterized protein YecE (DUF72 family)
MADRVGTSGWSYDEWTGPFYARLRREDHDEPALAEWARRLVALPVEGRIVVFKHEDEAAGPGRAARFTELIAEVAG